MTRKVLNSDIVHMDGNLQLCPSQCMYPKLQIQSDLFRSGPEGIKLFSHLTLLGTKFILLINVKILTNVGILTFISMMNTTSESFKAIKICSLQHFSFYEQLKILCSVELSMKKVLEPRGLVFLQGV